MKVKRYAEIDGKNWEVRIHLCAGCPEFIIGGHCGYEGNGCRFPEKRMERPINMYLAFSAYAESQGTHVGEVCRTIGNCVPVKE